MEQDKGLSKGTQCSLCKTSSALGLCCRDDLALTLAPRLQPILPPWNRCPAQFPSSCPPTQPPNPQPPSNLCSVLPFLPPKHPTIQVSSPFFCTFSLLKIFDTTQKFLICQRIRADQIVVVLRLRAPLWGAGGLTLALGNTGAHGTKHWSATCASILQVVVAQHRQNTHCPRIQKSSLNAIHLAHSPGINHTGPISELS